MQAMIDCNDYVVNVGRTRPEAARSLLVELSSLGQPAVSVHKRLVDVGIGIFEACAQWFRELDPSLPDLLPGAARAVIEGSYALATSAVVAGTEEAIADARRATFTHWLLGATGRAQAPETPVDDWWP